MDDVETGGAGALTADEAAFFESRGETAPPSEPTPEPAEAEAAPEGGGEEKPREPRYVPLSELIAERKRRQEHEKALAEQNERWARADERLRLLTEAQQARQQPAEPEPPGPDDPIGLIEHTSRELAAFKQQQAEERQRQQQAYEQNEQVNRLVGTYRARAEEFRQQTPDFDDAYQHVRAARARQLAVQGFSGDELQAVLAQDELSFAARALQQGANPGERLYALAKEYGYEPKAPAQVDPAAGIARQADVVARSKSLSQAGGTATSTRMDAKTLANMSNDDFEAFMAKNGAKGFRKALHS